MTEDLQDAIHAWVTQLRRDGYATTTVGRLIDEPPEVQAGVLVAVPGRYFTQCTTERGEKPPLPPQHRPDGAP